MITSLTNSKAKTILENTKSRYKEQKKKQVSQSLPGFAAKVQKRKDDAREDQIQGCIFSTILGIGSQSSSRSHSHTSSELR